MSDLVEIGMPGEVIEASYLMQKPEDVLHVYELFDRYKSGSLSQIEMFRLLTRNYGMLLAEGGYPLEVEFCGTAIGAEGYDMCYANGWWIEERMVALEF